MNEPTWIRSWYLERLAIGTLNAEWTEFENAATYGYARALVENKYRSRTEIQTEA